MRTIVEAAYAAKKSFFLSVVGTEKDFLMMGFPSNLSYYQEQSDEKLLVLTFPSTHLDEIISSIEEEELILCLSFDSLCTVKIPWSFVIALQILETPTRKWPTTHTSIPQVQTHAVKDNVVYLDQRRSGKQPPLPPAAA